MHECFCRSNTSFTTVHIDAVISACCSYLAAVIWNLSKITAACLDSCTEQRQMQALQGNITNPTGNWR